MASKSSHSKTRRTVSEKGTVLTVRFYEGDEATKPEYDERIDKYVSITRFRATKMVGEKTYTEPVKQTEKETQTYLNDKLKIEVPTKTPIDEQDNDKLAPV